MKAKTALFKFKGIVPLLLLLLLAFSGYGSQDTVEIYVSVEGDDSGSGSLSEPFASIPAAVDKVRSLRKSGNADPVIIYLREGRHQLNQTLVLGIEDGASYDAEKELPEGPGAGDIIPAYLTIAAYPGLF